VVEVFTLLDDEAFVKEGEKKDVEVAIRMRGCGDEKAFFPSLMCTGHSMLPILFLRVFS
jgi:hypothetical protein